MRYTDEITFVKKGKSKYDPDQGKHVELESSKKTDTTANVTELGVEKSITLFGSIQQGALVIRTMPLFFAPEWDQIEYEGKTYQLTKEQHPSNLHTIIVEEVVSK